MRSTVWPDCAALPHPPSERRVFLWVVLVGRTGRRHRSGTQLAVGLLHGDNSRRDANCCVGQVVDLVGAVDHPGSTAGGELGSGRTQTDVGACFLGRHVDAVLGVLGRSPDCAHAQPVVDEDSEEGPRNLDELDRVRLIGGVGHADLPSVRDCNGSNLSVLLYQIKTKMSSITELMLY